MSFTQNSGFCELKKLVNSDSTSPKLTNRFPRRTSSEPGTGGSQKAQCSASTMGAVASPIPATPAAGESSKRRPHIASKTRQQLESLEWETLPHPPYSPDIAPSDYHLFRALKNVLRGKRFVNFGEIESELTSFFNSQKPEFWVKGIQSLPDRWQQVIDSDGQYIVD